MPHAAILLIVHQATSKTHRVGRLLEERGFRLDVRCPNFGDALPETLDAHAGMVSFGGPMSANDDCEHEGIRVELDWLPVALESGKPILGICLGAQMIARVLGASVAPRADGLVEIGYREVLPTPEGAEVFPAPQHFYQWHREGFELPPGAMRLAGTEAFPNQAYRWGNAVWGVQFHAEVRGDGVERWTQMGRRRLVEPGADPRRRQLEDYVRYEPGIDRWLRGFLARLLPDPVNS